MIKRLNVKSTVKKSGLYVAESIATMYSEDDVVDILNTGNSLVLQVKGTGREVVVDYLDIAKEALEVA